MTRPRPGDVVMFRAKAGHVYMDDDCAPEVDVVGVAYVLGVFEDGACTLVNGDVYGLLSGEDCEILEVLP